MGKRRFPSVDNWMRGMAKREAKRREQEVTLGEKALLEQTIAETTLDAVGGHPEEASRVAVDVAERLERDGWRLVDPHEETIITLADLKRLQDAEHKLMCLENHGVDNWQGYSDAMKDYNMEDPD